MGRVVRPGQPAWTVRDSMLAIEWQRIEDGTCKGCGQPLEDSLAPDAQFETSVIKCHGCAAREEKSHAMSESNNGNHFGSRVLVHLVKESPEQS